MKILNTRMYTLDLFFQVASIGLRTIDLVKALLTGDQKTNNKRSLPDWLVVTCWVLFERLAPCNGISCDPKDVL